MRTSYSCSAYEWEFARLFSAVGRADRGYRNMPYIGCLAVPAIAITMFILYYLLQAVLPRSAEQDIMWLKDWAITAGLVVGGVIFIRSVNTPGRHRKYPDTAARVPLVVTDAGGIAVNLFNNLDARILPYINWSSVEHVLIDVTKANNHYVGGRVFTFRKELRFDEIKRRLPDFTETVKEIYDDRFTLLLNIGKGINTRTLKYAIIQIPVSWLYDGQFAALLGDIRSNVQAPIKYYDQHAERSFSSWADTYL